MNILAEMFEPTDWIILHTPFLYEPGVTKSVVLCDVRDFKSVLFCSTTLSIVDSVVNLDRKLQILRPVANYPY